MFVSPHGSHVPYARFEAALQAGDLAFILRHADGLTFGLPDAVKVCLLISRQAPERLEAASVRWIRRYAAEASGQLWNDYRLIVEAFDALLGEPKLATGTELATGPGLATGPKLATGRLLALCSARGLDR